MATVNVRQDFSPHLAMRPGDALSSAIGLVVALLGLVCFMLVAFAGLCVDGWTSLVEMSSLAVAEDDKTRPLR